MKTLLVLIACGFFLNGCVPVLVGAGVVTGYSLSNDSATGNVSSDYRNLWDITMEKVKSMEAEIIEAKESRGIIKARISDHAVAIKITTIDAQTQRLKVSARRYLLPKPQFAQKVFLKIIGELK
jgi:hypothetical protein